MSYIIIAMGKAEKALHPERGDDRETALSHFVRTVKAVRFSMLAKRTLADRRLDRETAIIEALGYLNTDRTQFEGDAIQRYVRVLRETDPNTARVVLRTVRAAGRIASIPQRDVHRELGISTKR